MKKLAVTILFLCLINCAQAQKLEWTNPDGLGKNPAFSQVLRAGKLLFIAGQTGVAADGKVVGPRMKQQYEQALNNLFTALKSQGTDLAHVAKMTTYVTAMDEFRTPEMVDLRVKLSISEIRSGLNSRPSQSWTVMVEAMNPGLPPVDTWS